MDGVRRDDRRGAGRGHVPRRHQARDRAPSDRRRARRPRARALRQLPAASPAAAGRHGAASCSASAPGAVTSQAGELELNAGRADRPSSPVTNRGDRPIQVGSHYHFVETNRALVFDRARGVRHAPRHPGRHRRAVRARRDQDACALVAGAARSGGTRPRPSRRMTAPHRSRRHYADIYGPTTGDRVRLGDTGLVAEVERDATVYGDECKFGGGKVLRDGMGQAAGVADADALDCVITNALDRRLDRHLQGRRRHQGRPHRRHRQGRQSRRDGRRDARA